MSQPPFGDPGVCPTIALFSLSTNQSPIGGSLSTTSFRLNPDKDGPIIEGLDDPPRGDSCPALSSHFVDVHRQQNPRKDSTRKKTGQRKGRSRETLGRTTEKGCACPTSYFDTHCGRACYCSLCPLVVSIWLVSWTAIRLVGNGQGEWKIEHPDRTPV